MIDRRSRLERAVIGAVLLVVAICCGCVVDATSAVERANAHRRTQLGVLAAHLEHPESVPTGRIEALEGLFAQPLQRVVTVAGPVIAFRTDGERTGS